MAANQTFGESVAEARALLGMSVTGAAGTLQMTESMLEDIEDGLVDMNPELQEIFERAYSIDLTSAVSGPPRYVEREPLSYDAEAGLLKIGSLGVRFRKGVDDNDVLLRGFSSAVRRLRRLSPSVPIKLRAADMPMLAQLMDLEDPDLDARARFWFGQPADNAQSFSTLMRLSLPPKNREA